MLFLQKNSFHKGKARQGKFIYIAHFIRNGNSKCFTKKKLKKSKEIRII